MQLCLVSAVHLQQDIQSEKKERSDYKSEVNKRDNKSETDSLLSVHRRVTVPLLHGQKSLQLSGCAQPIPIATIKHFCQEKPPEPFAVCCSRIRQPAYLVKVKNKKKKDILRDQRSSDGCTYTAKNSLVLLLLLKADLMPLQSGSNVEVWNDQDTGLTVASHICIKLNVSEEKSMLLADLRMHILGMRSRVATGWHRALLPKKYFSGQLLCLKQPLLVWPGQSVDRSTPWSGSSCSHTCLCWHKGEDELLRC